MITRQTASGRSPVSFPDSAEFELPLTTSVTPLAGFGSVTYTRATPATVIDHEGIMRNCISGEVRFTGARRVQNLASYSEDAGNAYWIKSRATVTSNSVVDPDGNLVADTIVGDGTGPSYFYKGFSFVSGNKYIFSACFKAANSSTVSITSFGQTGACSFDLSTGTAGTPTGIASNPTMQSLGNGWYRCSVLFTANATGTNNVGFVSVNYLGDICYICRMQDEDVTGQSIQTVGDYVSTNVLSSPFHGAMVDGVKYFNTTLAGDTISASTLKGVLIEGTRTNLLTQSNTFSSWSKAVATMTITPNQGTGPDGTNSLWKIAPGTSMGLQGILLGATVTAAVHAFTVYAKAGENSVLQLITQGTLSLGYVNFDLSDGTVGSSSLWTGSITPVAGFPGVYKCVAITNALVAGTGNIYISQVPTSTTGRSGNMVGDGVSGLYVWGAQLELGSMSTSHLFTTGSTVTRNDDLLSYNASNAVSVKGAAYLEFTMGDVPPVGVHRRALGLSNFNNRFQLVATSTTNNRTAILVGNGSSVMSTDLSIAMSTGSYSKVAGKWVNGSVANLFQNGSKSSDLANPQVAVTQIDVGAAGGNPIFGSIKNLKVWKNPPTDSELQALTTL